VPKRLGVNLVSNGTFDANIDGWTSATGPGAHAWASGALRRAVGGGDGGSYVDVPVIAGRTYQVGGAVFNLTGSGGCTMNFYSGGGFTGLGASIGSTGSALLVAQTNNIRPYLYTDTTRGVDFDNIEVREVLEWSSYAMSFDGNNDFLQTGITTGNEGWVCAGVTVAPGETLQTIVSSGAGDTTQKGVFLVTFNGTAIYAYLGNGTARQQAQTTITAGVPQVASMGWSASGVFAGVNGTESASTAFSGDVTGPSPLRIGQYIGGTLPLNGPMTATVICPVLPSAADRALIRRFIGSLQGQTL
jgi:hypothetical protein